MENLAPPRAFILHNNVRHARFLPVESAHAFAYSTLAIFVSLSALESGKLDLYGGRLFGYSPAGSRCTWARVLGIKPEHYLHGYSIRSGNEKDTRTNTCHRTSIREKLEDVLERFGHDPRLLEDAWMQTMPRYFGIGFNPLTVYYCYKKGDPNLWVLVLEVHNAHEERHVYVLKTGTEHEDSYVPPRYDHSWTFPRQFHVSPFNDRSGFYSCSIVDPPYPPFNIPSSSQYIPLDQAPPMCFPAIRIQMYTSSPPDITSSKLDLPPPSDTECLSQQLKMTATFRPISVAALSSNCVIRALFVEPFALLLTFIRIGHQAIQLHYKRRLDTYMRPEPRAVDRKLEIFFEEDAAGMRRVQRDRDYELGIGGGLKWQDEGIMERYARQIVEQFIESRSRELGIRVNIDSTNPSENRRSFPIHIHTATPAEKANNQDLELTIVYRTPNAFLLILLAPSPVHALLSGRNGDHAFVVSDDELFVKIFTPSSSLLTPPTYIQRLLQSLRCTPIPAALILSSSPNTFPYSSLTEDQERLARGEAAVSSDIRIPQVHPLDLHFQTRTSGEATSNMSSTLANLTTLLVITIQLGLTVLEKWWSTVSGTRFVYGGDPWGTWERVLANTKNITYMAQDGKEVQFISRGQVHTEGNLPDTSKSDSQWIGSTYRPFK